MPVINTYQQYRALPRVTLQIGDILIKKVFSETCANAVEWGITAGQKLFAGDQTVKTGGLFSSEKFKIAYRGSHTSEHAAIAIATNEIAEAEGSGVITARIERRINERYCIYRCSNPALINAAVLMAKGLSIPHHNVVLNQLKAGATTGGKYSMFGALTSNFRRQTFNQGTTETYLTHIVDFVMGLRNDRPDMFCSEFAMTCYEAGAVATLGKTAFGTNPKGMSPMHLEDVLNSRGDIMTLVGKYDSENDKLFQGVDAALRAYGSSKHWWNKRGASDQSTQAVEILNNLLLLGENTYLLAVLAVLLGKQPIINPGIAVPGSIRLDPKSSLYKALDSQAGLKRFFA